MNSAPFSPTRFAAFRILAALWAVWLALNGLLSNALNPLDFSLTTLAALAGTALAAGLAPRWTSLIILVVWWWLPGFHPLGWDGAGGLMLLLLLPTLASEPGGPITPGHRRAAPGWPLPIRAWQVSRQLWIVTLLLHGVTLLSRPAWRSGDILANLPETPLAGPLGRWLLLLFPETALSPVALGWAVLLIGGPVLFWLPTTQRLGYLLVVFATIVFALLYGGSELAAAAVLLTWMTFDGRWLAPRPPNPGGDILFFDGVCHLCHHTVEFALDEAPEGTLRFAPLQGETASRLLGGAATEMRSVIYLRGAESPAPVILRESDAVIALWESFGGLWLALAWLARLIPRPLRNPAYRFVARHRYRWFGKMESCPLPFSEVRGRFLP